MMGTISIIWAVAAIMVVMALSYGAGLWTVRATAAVLLTAISLAVIPSDKTENIAYSIGLKFRPVGIILYEKDTNYCYVAVRSQGGNPEKRIFVQDKLTHSQILIGEPNKLQYHYEQIMAGVTHRFAAGKDNPFFWC
jgi:hypothetical protein